MASRTIAMSQREAGRTAAAAVWRWMGQPRGRGQRPRGAGLAAGRAGAAAKDGQAMAKPRAALAHQRAATCARGSTERGHGDHRNAVTAHSRPSNQKRVVHEF